MEAESIKRLLVAGYYGEGNLGDDALLLGLAEGLGKADVQLTALSGNPEATNRILGIRSAQRRDFSSVKREIEECDALVFGGGGLLQDKTSLRSLIYYTQMIRMAKAAGKKVALLGQGVGPIDRFLGKRAAVPALKSCDLICVRDAKSQAVVRGLGVPNRVEITADLAWLLPNKYDGDAFQLGSMKTVAVSARPWGNNKMVTQVFGGFTQMLFKNGYVPVLVEMDQKMDSQVLDSIAKLHGGRCPELKKVGSPREMLGKLSRVHAVVAMRLHAGIFAAISGIAPIMVSYDPKVASFAQAINVPCLALEGLTVDRLWDAFRRHEDGLEQANKNIEEQRTAMAAAAMRNVELLLQLLG